MNLANISMILSRKIYFRNVSLGSFNGETLPYATIFLGLVRSLVSVKDRKKENKQRQPIFFWTVISLDTKEAIITRRLPDSQ